MMRNDFHMVHSLVLLMLFSIGIGSHHIAATEYESAAVVSSPYTQLKHGTYIDQIKCNDGKVLLQNGARPACVTDVTADKLKDRGWSAVVQQVYSKPVLNPTYDVISKLMPQEHRVDNLLRYSPENFDDLVEQMLELTGDRLGEKKARPNGDLVYFTEKGRMELTYQPLRYFNFKYDLYGDDRIPESDARRYTHAFIERLGLTPEIVGAPSFCGNPGHCIYTYAFRHFKDGWHIDSDAVVTHFAPGHTTFYSKNWHVDYEDIELFDLDQSRQNAIEYLSGIDELSEPSCDISYNPYHAHGHEGLSIIDGRFVYSLYSGTCQAEYSDGHYHWYTVVVDALTGKPLYAENKMVF